MYDELTEIDIQKMREEIRYRVQELRPKLIEDVQTARAFGDLSENFEYKCAKQEKNRNESRIRYLERMIRTAKVISAESREDAVGLFDTVGKALLGRKVGETVHVKTGGSLEYDMVIRSIEKGEDDASIAISSF